MYICIVLLPASFPPGDRNAVEVVMLLPLQMSIFVTTTEALI